MTRLAAVLMGILVGLFGPASGVAAFLLLVPPLPENPVESISQLNTDLTLLRDDLGVVRRGTVTPRQLADVETEVAALKDRPLAEPATVAELKADLVGLDDRLLDLQRKPPPPEPLKVAVIDLGRALSASKTYSRLNTKWEQARKQSLKDIEALLESHRELVARLDDARAEGAAPDSIPLLEIEVSASAALLKSAQDAHEPELSKLRDKYRRDIFETVMPIISGFVQRRGYDFLLRQDKSRKAAGTGFDGGASPADNLLYYGDARIKDITPEIIALLK